MNRGHPHLNEKAAAAMTVTDGGKSNPFDGMRYTRVYADPQGFAATAITPLDNGDGDVEWRSHTI